jgi:WD40 repeat protein
MRPPMKKKLFLGLLLCLLPLTSISSQVLVQTGHTAAVRDIAVASEARVIATGGADGTVKIWNESGRILSRLNVGPYPIVRVVLRENSDILAVVQARGLREYRVSAWNWRQGRELYGVTESNPITHIAFSPRGSYLAYSVSEIRSLRFLDAETGRNQSLIDLGFGVVTYFVIARSESNIMTYTPATGEIFYFDLRSGRRIESLRIATQLQHVSLLPSRRHIAAVSRGELLIVDIVDGQTEARTIIGAVATVTVHPDSGAIAVLGTDGELSGYRFSDDRIFPLFWNARLPGWEPSAVSFSGARLLGGTRSGELEFLPFGGTSPTVLAERTVDNVSAVVGYEDTLYLATEETLFSLSSPSVMDGNLDGQAGPIRFERADNPVGNPSHLAVSQDGTLLLWQPGSRGPGLLDITELRQPETVAEITQSIRTISVGPDGFLAVQANGAVTSLDPETLSVDTLYSGVGIEAAVRLAGNRVVIGKTRSDTFDSSLVRIDTATGETVPLPTEAFLSYRLAVAPNNRVLYAIELIRRGDETSTALTRYSGASFDRRTVLAERDDEILDALLLVAPDNGRLISDLPTGELAEYDGRRWLPFESSNSFPVSAAVYGSLVVAAGNDGAVYAWDRVSRRLRYTLQVFQDGEWVVFSDRRRFVPSSGRVMGRLTTTETRLGQLPDVERYRLDIEVERR